jgi:DNA excision repair protein ERCC-2
MKKITLAVSEFALPSPMVGSIDSQSGLGRSQQIGQEIHTKVQQARASTFASYKSEVAVAHEIESGPYLFEVKGRMDGFFGGEHPLIEEIKSSFNIFDLQRNLKEQQDTHPYCLQLRTYGYIYWLQNRVEPKLRLHLVSSRNGETIDLEIPLNVSEYEEWLSRRISELTAQVQADEKRIARRKKAAEELQFPFAKPRAGQIELIKRIEVGMTESRPMLLQAPTGLGKTVGVLYPTLKEALARGQKVIYVTPKNSQHAVAEEAVEKLREAGPKLRALTITAKSKMCFKNEALCNPTYCEYAKDHYKKVSENEVIEKLAKKKSLTARTFKKIAEEYQVCPFEIQLDAALDADAVICDYNYVFAPRSAFGRLAQAGLANSGKPNLVIDEAHNLPARAMDYYSPALSSFALIQMREDSKNLPKAHRRKAQSLIDACLAVVKSCGVSGERKTHRINAPVAVFQEMDSELKSFLSTYLSSDVEIQPRDVVMRLSFYWSEFTAALEFVKPARDGELSRFFTSYNPETATVKITCCDASEMLQAGYGEYAQIVAFSATLKPFDYYSQLSGLREKDLITAEFTSPFAKANRKILAIPQISSKYSDREKSYPRIAEVIHKISSLKNGNYIAFFPSFDFMERVLAKFETPANFLVLRQERSMRRDDIDAVLESLKDPSTSHILFAVQGGVFSEGVDYPGRMLIGAFIVGPPLPNFDMEREMMRNYYEENYAAGFDYAYTFPAMAKAVQAAGRVIRSESDKGIIVLMDNRFIQGSYVKSMPQDWFAATPQEMVSQSILKDVADFWNSTQNTVHEP